ncbi:MAG TPA: hypothetical protein VL069_15100 [Opitutus sp.]|nr:hypothetical protein [Opitutus sp.]
MNTIHTFKASRFYFAIIAAIAVAPPIATKLSSAFDIHVNPVTLAFVFAGLVAVVISMVFENRKWV